jgi:1-deoxy-D-xylulose-5-phosphate synthase
MRETRSLPIGSWEKLREGSDIAILAVGAMIPYALEAAEKLEDESISVEVINARFIKPLDTEMLRDISNRFQYAVSIEDGQKAGGFGSAVLEAISDNELDLRLSLMGYEDKFVEHGSQEQLITEQGLDSDGIANKVRELISTKIHSHA